MTKQDLANHLELIGCDILACLDRARRPLNNEGHNTVVAETYWPRDIEQAVKGGSSNPSLTDTVETIRE